MKCSVARRGPRASSSSADSAARVSAARAFDRATCHWRISLRRRFAPGEAGARPSSRAELVGRDSEREGSSDTGKRLRSTVRSSRLSVTASETLMPILSGSSAAARSVTSVTGRTALQLGARVDAPLPEARAEITEQRLHELRRESAAFELELHEGAERAAVLRRGSTRFVILEGGRSADSPEARAGRADKKRATPRATSRMLDRVPTAAASGNRHSAQRSRRGAPRSCNPFRYRSFARRQSPLFPSES